MRDTPIWGPAPLTGGCSFVQVLHTMNRLLLLRRRALLTSLLLLPLAPASALSAASAPVATQAVQVTPNPDPSRAHSSPQISVNPRNGELVIVESDVRGDRQCKVRISIDDGRSWFPGGEIMRKPFVDCSFYAEYGPYATMAFGRDGVLYIAFVASEVLNRARDATPRHLFLARSGDGGRTFVTTTVFEAPDGNPDRGLNKGPMLAVDPRDSSRVYVGWRQGVFRNGKEKLKSNVAASTDGGRTFGPPVDITDERGGDYPALAVDGNGKVHAVYWTRAFPPPAEGQPATVRPIQYASSTNAGKTWARPTAIDPGNEDAHRPPLLAADPDSGALYLVWYSHADPSNSAEGFEGRIDVFLRRSVDGGKSWSDRLVLNDDRDNPKRANKYEVGVSLAPNGRVDVAWYDFRLSPTTVSTGSQGESGLQDVYYTFSTDRGRSFRRNLRITDRSIDRSIGVWSNNVDSKFNLGIASTNDSVYFAWQDTRNGKPEFQAEDVYAASLKLDGPVPRSTESEDRVPAWLVLAAGLGLGMGIAGLLAWALTRS